MMKNMGKSLTTTYHFDPGEMEYKGEETCGGCGCTVQLYSIPIIGGPNKGERQTFRYGCQCENIKLAKQTREVERKAKRRYMQQVFDRYSLINPELQKVTLEDYEPTNQSQIRAKKSAEKYINIFDKENPFNLMFAGEVGVGKSHLAKCIADGVMDKTVTESEYKQGKRGYNAIFISVPKLLRKIRATYNDKSEVSEEQIYQTLEKVDLLVLDDLGVEKQSEWATERIFDLIDSRQGMHTIFTTNIAYSDLEQLKGERDFSRILGNKQALIEVTGENNRMKA